MFSLRAKGAVFRFYHKRCPPIFQGAHHRCEAAYKNYGKAATTTPPPFGTAYHLSTRERWHIEPSGQRPVNPKNLSPYEPGAAFVA